ncbi:MAG TPA: AbgT family transporter [Verrucomicrobiae bacterium]|nr:AbgT family transporter [Verrucomicrobiae bacterium]
MTQVETPKTRGHRALDWVERVGNKLPDPAILFVWALLLTWLASVVLAPIRFSETDPRTIVKDASGEVVSSSPIRVKNQLTGEALTSFLSKMVKTFTDFHPLGVVLVALLGVGVAEHTGFLNACLKALLRITAKSLLTPMLLLVSIVSHAAGDAGYVLVIPLGGIIFAAAGRHPLAGIACAFAGVSGGFSACFLPTTLDPLLQGLTQSAAQIIDPNRTVNPLCNWYFTSASCLIIIAAGWWLTDRVIEPRLQRHTRVDASVEDLPRMDEMSAREYRALWSGLGAILLGFIALAAAALPANSPLRSKTGELTGQGAPLMDSIVPLIFILSLLPAVVYGWVAGTVRGHKDVIQGMSKSMSAMSYYLVMAFFAAQFTFVFRESNVGALLALKGSGLLQSWQLPAQVTIVGIILISAGIDLAVGSASAKWALLGPIFVPMLMQVGISPELTQAAYRIGDSSVNIITPLLPYFPLIVVYCQRYVKSTGIGTLVSMMLPYSIAFLIAWTVFLMLYWALGLPLGLQATYRYP